MAWSNVAKPTGPTYTLVNPQGKEIYDQPDLTYDDADVFYDGINEAMWTSVAKPTSSVFTKVAKPT